MSKEGTTNGGETDFGGCPWHNHCLCLHQHHVSGGLVARVYCDFLQTGRHFRVDHHVCFVHGFDHILSSPKEEEKEEKEEEEEEEEEEERRGRPDKMGKLMYWREHT